MKDSTATWFPCWLRWVLWTAYFLAWTAALLMSNPVSEKTRAQLPGDPFYFAKTLHVVAYAVGTVLTGWLRVSGKWRWLLLGFLFFHGIASELLQHIGKHIDTITISIGDYTFVVLSSTRTGSVRDVLLDHFGVILGVLLTWKWWRTAGDVNAVTGNSIKE